jgi:hypothetical protein
MVGKFGAPANANIVVLNAAKVKFKENTVNLKIKRSVHTVTVKGKVS